MGDLARGATLPGASLTVALRVYLWDGVQASPGLALDSGLSLRSHSSLLLSSFPWAFPTCSPGEFRGQEACSGPVRPCFSALPSGCHQDPALLISTGRPLRGLALCLSEHLLFHPDGILSLRLVGPGIGNSVSLIQLKVKDSSRSRNSSVFHPPPPPLSSSSHFYLFLLLLSLLLSALFRPSAFPCLSAWARALPWSLGREKQQ